ncbi:type II toxin-antitoxin system antitoxin, TscA family [Mammaliicoccus sciuri]|uniref:TscA family type II toxin-antitoxin system antitoxin n=1 Tax=Mammaliicoccus sciuri TaxID=1296 RepID=UPI0034DCD28D
MTHQQVEKLNDIVNTLHSVKHNKVPTFIHSNITSLKGIGKIEYSYEVDREEHLESMIEWAIDQIEQNFDLEIDI